MSHPSPEKMHRELQDFLNAIAEENGTHCGIPVAIMSMCKSFKNVAEELITLSPTYVEMLVQVGMLNICESEEAGENVSNVKASWITSRPRKGQLGHVTISQEAESEKRSMQFIPFKPHEQRLEFLARTIAYLTHLGIAEAEIKARLKLEKLLSPEQNKALLLADAFFETGFSGIQYLLRRNRPTLAFRMDHVNQVMRPLCALCLHPLGWYTNSFTGILPPSDDMIAHLLMIRANEHLFWRKANQHPLDIPQSGV